MRNGIPVYDICSISEFSKDDILISRFGSYSETHQHLHRAHRHNFYHLVFFTKGAGNHSIDFQTFEVKPYQIYFMIPGQVHSWNFEGPADGYIVNFSAHFFQSFLLRPNFIERFAFFSGSVEDEVLDIPAELQEKLLALFEDMLSESAKQEMADADYIRVLLLSAFIQISQFRPGQVPSAPSAYNDTLLMNFRKLIEEHYNTLRLPRDYADLLYITPNHLNALCNDLLGIPAGEVIRNRVILEAKRMLVNIDTPVSAIAYELNFSDNSYFTKFFKRHTGQTPDEFRRKAIIKHKKLNQ